MKLRIAFICFVLTASCGPPDEGLRQLDAEINRAANDRASQRGESNNLLRVVGSSTVAPFAEAVAEQFGASRAYRTPVVETLGTGGGLKVFCAGRGRDHPSIATASRPIKPAETALCVRNGISPPLEVPIGYDGIALVNRRSGPDFALSLTELYLALASRLPGDDGEWRANPYRKWSDVSADLPDIPIRVVGPPPTSGTRDAFVELALGEGARGLPRLAELELSDPAEFRRRAYSLRNDGAWIDSGENDAAILHMVIRSDTTLGVLGFSYLSQNADRVKPALIDKMAPSMTSISSGDYRLARALFLYIRRDDLALFPALGPFVLSFLDDDAIGPGGYLGEKGLIPISENERMVARANLADALGG
ncbi:MAG: substrate-binding domain-containing protein [Pseudomonadota bacterium]